MTSHAYLNTRVSLLASRLLPAGAWDRLVTQPIAENASLLEQHDLAAMAGLVSVHLAGPLPDEPHRGR